MKTLTVSIVSITALLMWSSCAKEVSQEELIKAAVELKVEQWKLAERKRCEEEALTAAEAYVDSLLVTISLETKLDTIPKPLKPEKPEKPVFKERPDSITVKPILED